MPCAGRLLLCRWALFWGPPRSVVVEALIPKITRFKRVFEAFAGFKRVSGRPWACWSLFSLGDTARRILDCIVRSCYGGILDSCGYGVSRWRYHWPPLAAVAVQSWADTSWAASLAFFTWLHVLHWPLPALLMRPILVLLRCLVPWCFTVPLWHCRLGAPLVCAGTYLPSLCAGARLLNFVASCRVRVGVTRGSLGAAGVGFPVTARTWIRVDDSVSMTLAWASSSSEYRATYWQTRHPLVARTWAGSRGGLAVGPPWQALGGGGGCRR